MAICKLCKEDKNLIKKSHIIPDFLHKGLFDTKHKLMKFNAVGFKLASSKISRLPTGEYESGILCEKCDGEIIGQYESYLAAILENQNITSDQKPQCKIETNENGVKLLAIQNIDYKKLKLCLLSILWRSSITTRKTFKEVSLGPYEEKIRKQIIEGNPSADSNLEIAVLSWTNDKRIPTDIIGQPRRHKIEGSTFYSILVKGYLVVYFISSSSQYKEIKNHRIKKDNTLSIVFLQEGYGMEFLIDYTNAKEKNSAN